MATSTPSSAVSRRRYSSDYFATIRAVASWASALAFPIPPSPTSCDSTAWARSRSSAAAAPGRDHALAHGPAVLQAVDHPLGQVEPAGIDLGLHHGKARSQIGPGRWQAAVTQGEAAVAVACQIAYPGDAGQQDSAVAHQAGFEADVERQAAAVDLRMPGFELIEHLHLGVGGAGVGRGEHLVAPAAQQLARVIHQQGADCVTA